MSANRPQDHQILLKLREVVQRKFHRCWNEMSTAGVGLNGFIHQPNGVLMSTTNLTLDSFESTVTAEGITIVDFWAEWCGPCKMIAPVLEELASEYGEKLKICKMDVDANPETAPKYGIRGIPTLILFNNGDVAGTKVGALSKSQLSEVIDSAI